MWLRLPATGLPTCLCASRRLGAVPGMCVPGVSKAPSRSAGAASANVTAASWISDPAASVLSLLSTMCAQHNECVITQQLTFVTSTGPALSGAGETIDS